MKTAIAILSDPKGESEESHEKRKTMKAYITRSYGPEAHFEETEIPVPEPTSGQILIEVKATSLNPIDNMFLRQDMGFNPDLPAALQIHLLGLTKLRLRFSLEFSPSIGLIN